MKQRNRLLALLLVLVLALTLPVAALADALDLPAETGTLAEDYTGKTVILHTNDVHGALEGYACVAQLKKDLTERGAEVILVDCGDFSQGSPYVSMSMGASAVTLMNAVGYDLITLGNHELDYSYDQMMVNMSNAEFEVICANLLKDGEAPFEGTTVIEKGGMKIGFFGLDTPEAKTKTNPTIIVGVDVLNNSNGKTDLTDCAVAQVEALKEEGVDLIIGLWHLGIHDESAVDGHRSIDVFKQLDGVDMVIDGHSHTVMTGGPEGETIQSTGTLFANIGVVVIDNGTKTIESHFLIPVEGLEKDPEIAAMADAIIEEVDTQLGESFAVSEVSLNGKKAPEGNRDSETNNGDFIADALLWSVIKNGGSLDVPDANIIAITNGGGIRAAIEPGEITMKDINSVLPFGNTVAVVYVTGAELLETLEASTFATPIGGFPQTSGIKWTLNTTKVYDAKAETYPDSTYYGPASIQRVSVQSINGEAFDPEATYAVVTNNFCAAGGDTYYALLAATSQFDTGIPMDEAVIDYIMNKLDGVIGQEYAGPRGDLTIINMDNTVAKPTAQTLIVDGEEKEAEIYNINDENYFKLRDIAMLFSGTDAQFEVTYDKETNSIAIETGKAYTPVGGELEAHADRSGSIRVSPQTLTVDGGEEHLTAFHMEGNNFFRLKDLGRVLGFDVSYDEVANAMVVTTAAAEEAAA